MPNPTTYVALLRGVNVGGRNIMSMTALRQCLEQLGLTNVITFIQSGNVAFESIEKNGAKLTRRIESAVSAALGIDSRVVLLSQAQLKAIVADAPAVMGRELRAAPEHCLPTPRADRKSGAETGRGETGSRFSGGRKTCFVT